VPILTWLDPSGVDAETASTGKIDIAVGSVDVPNAVLISGHAGVHVQVDPSGGS
jgi:alanine racemase